jgi:hypothetical protein
MDVSLRPRAADKQLLRSPRRPRSSSPTEEINTEKSVEEREMRRGVQFEDYFEVNEVGSIDGCYKPCKKSPHPFTLFSHRSVKTQKSLLFPPGIRSRPKKVENRPGLRTERLDSWISKAARLREDTIWVCISSSSSFSGDGARTERNTRRGGHERG